MTLKNGLVIAFDGPDGVGKSTQLALTADWLETQGFKVHRTRSNGGTPIGEELRKASLSQNERSALTDVYITLAMGQALAEDLDKRRAAGELCLIDRCPLAHLAYNTFGSQLPDKNMGYTAAELMFKAWRIDILLYFEAPQSVLDDRRKARTDKPTDYYEQQGTEYNQRVREGYQAGLKLLKDKPELVGQVISIDATPDIESIQVDVQSKLNKNAIIKRCSGST